MKLVTKKASDGFPPGLAGTWVEGCDWQFGNPAKQYSAGITELVGFGCHSMVGTLAGSYSRLFSQETLNSGRFTDYAAVSWHFSNPKAGRLIQHYPLEVACWCHGSREANTKFLAMEMEGGYEPHNEPLTDSQMENCLSLWTLLDNWRSFDPLTEGHLIAGINLLEHRQLVALYGGKATACASGRYGLVWDRWDRGDRIQPWEQAPAEGEMNEADVRRIVREELEAAGITGTMADGNPVPKFKRFYEVMVLRLREAAGAFDISEIPDGE